MTEYSPPTVDRSLPLHEQEAILSNDHNAGMHYTQGTVRDIIDVSPKLARVVLHVEGLADDPQWTVPNVSIRIHVTDGGERLTRIYTVRSADSPAETIAVDVVRHGKSSLMMRWLDRLRIGDVVMLVGPRPHFQFPHFPDRELLVFADATAIPALFALLLQAPDDLCVRGWVATDDVVAFEELPAREGIDLQLIEPCHGYSRHFSQYSTGADVVVWGAGERDAMRAVRSHFRNTVGLAKEQVAVYGYWKIGTTNTTIDEARLRAYEALLAKGGTITELDDLALPV